MSLVLHGFSWGGCALVIHAADLSSTYQNSRVTLGGGGFITGIQFSPYVKDLLFARGDVTGFFKWVPDTVTPAGGHWQQTLDFFGGSQRLMYGCYAMAFDPTVHTTIYGAFGESADPYAGSTSPGIYKSTDSGNTWTQIYQTAVAANGNDNNEGEKTFGRSLVVDPNNNQILYYGSQEVVNPYAPGGPVLTGGLRVSTDGGQSWTVNASAPWGPALSASNLFSYSTGIRNVLCDARQGTIVVNGQTRTKVVYLGIRSSQGSESSFTGGIFQSTDGGQTFSLMSGTPSYPKDLVPIGTGSEILITTEDHGVWILQNGTFTNGIGTGTDSYGGEINGICVDPFNSNQLLGRGNYRLWRSTNAGASWTPGSSFNSNQTTTNPTDTVVKYSDNVWTYTMAGGGANVALDPFRQGTAWEADCYSVCRTNNVWANNAIWNPIIYGLESTVPLWMSCPPSPSSNLLYYGCQDVKGFSWTDLGIYPTQFNPSDPSGQCGESLRCYAWCESQPTDVMAIYQEPSANSVFVSTSDGYSWVQQPMPPNTAAGVGYVTAISSTTPNHAVFVGENSVGSQPYFTTNAFSATAGNLTWTPSAITLPSNYSIYQGGLYDENICGLTADTVIGDKFYLDTFGIGTPDEIFVSTDGGKTFNIPAGQSIPWSSGASIHASPGVANDLWALTGGGGNQNGGNLYHSTNGGVTWSLFPSASNFGHVLNYALGANAPASTNPTLYIAGQYYGSYGVFRSNDMGVTFDTISNDANIGVVSGARGYSSPWCMAADRHVYGRVYIGGEGTGISYLQPIGSGTGAGSSILFYEGFAYNPGNLSGNGGWSGPTAYQVQSGGLGYTDRNGASLTTSGNSAKVYWYYPGSITKTLPTTIGAAGTTAYWSFIYTGGYNDSYCLTDSGGHNVAAVNALNGYWQIYANGQWNNSGVTASGSAFLVVRLDFSTSGTQYRLYVNPILGSESANAPSVNITDSHTATINGINWYEAYYTNQNLDEIRIGTTWASATPNSGVPFYEGFSYNAGNLVGNGHWSGPAAYQVQNGSLSYQDSTGASLPTTGNSLKVSSYYPGVVSDTLPVTIGYADSTAYWSFIYTGGMNDSFSLTDTGGHSVASVNARNGTWQIYANGQWNDSGVTANGSAYLVVRLDFSASGTAYRLYVNPQLSSESANTPAVNVRDSYSGTINGLWLYEAYYTNQWLDEVRVGGTWSTAVP